MSWAALSLKNLTNALSKVDDWEGLGIQLDIEYHELQKIFKDWSTTEERKRAMLQFWLEGNMKPSWEALIAALDKLNLKLIAEEIKREYNVPSSSHPGDVPPLEPIQSENVTPTDTLPTDPPSNSHTDLQEQTSTQRVRKVQQEIGALVDLYDDLVEKTGVFLSKRQAISPDFLFPFRISIAVLPTSLKYQHRYFLEHHSSQIAKATTVEEIFSILNRYCNFMNCSLLTHIINKFGDEELKKQQSSYTEALQEFRSQTKFSDFFKAYTENPNIPSESVALTTKMGSEWEHRTLQDAEEYRKCMAQCSFLADSALFFQGGGPGSIYLMWSVSKHAIRFLAAAMNSEFLQHHSVEEVTIDGVDLEDYKHQHYYGLQFTVISQPVDELSEGLIWASREGCLEDVVFLLTTGVEVNSRGQWEGRTALMAASVGGYLDVVKKLLRAQAGVDLQDEDGWTALIWASYNGNADIVRELITGGAQVDLQNNDGWTALIWASYNGNADIVRELITGGAQVDLQNNDGRTALIWASLKGNTEIVRELITGGAQVDQQDNIGMTALYWASYKGNAEIVRELITAGAQVNLQNKDGWSALRWASFKGHADIVQELITGGARVNLQYEDGETALIYAVRHHHTETMKVLLAASADVNLQEKTSGRSAVFYGAEKGDLEIVKLLIEGGANLSLKDKDGVTADEVAEVEGHHEVCEELRKHMRGGRRPLSKAVRDRVLATGQLLRTLYKRLEERILRTQKKALAGKTQGLDPEISLPSTPSKKGIKGPRELRQQEEYVLSQLY